MPRTQTSHDEILRIAQENLGFTSLRPGQEEAICAVLDGQDTLVVQPTGSGKSAIYQIAGLMIEGATVVVSPLIALQKDQLDAIQGQNGAEGAVVNSVQPAAYTREAFQRLRDGAVEYFFLAPEQLRKRETMERLRAANVSLFVIDEAHCISEWGHSFRPDYLRLGQVIEELGHPTVLALTATASPEVRDEIVERLGMRRPHILAHGLDRPNIHLGVERVPSERKKLEALSHRVSWAEKPGIVYVSTRKNAEAIMASLREEGVEAVFYHGGLGATERAAVQQRFMDGEADVIVATNAFGMGVDKANVRFVYHYDVSDSLDAYYQEVGRAGRDGKPAEAILFYRPENAGIHRFHAGSGKLDEVLMEQIAQAAYQEGGPTTAEAIAARTELPARKVDAALRRLEDAGAVRMLSDGTVELIAEAELAQAARSASEAHLQYKERQRHRLEHMQRYADIPTCRRVLLLGYFGETVSSECGYCDNCYRSADPKRQTSNVGTRREVSG